jgi:hypothetical protein
LRPRFASARLQADQVTDFVRFSVRQMLAGGSVGDALTLGFRLVGARAMSVVTLLAAAFLVRIEAFAEFGVYQTFAVLLTLSIFLRYDAGLLAARSEASAHAVMRLCCVVGALVWSAATVVAVLAASRGWVKGELALLFPFTLWSRSLLSLMFALATRHGNFTAIGRASLVQSIVQPLSLLGLIELIGDGAVCLAGADVIGHSIGLAYLAWCNRGPLAGFARGWSASSLRQTAWLWRSWPLYNLPGSFLSLAFATSPLLIAPLSASAVFAGHIALAYRIFDVPTQIVTATATPLFLHRLRPSEEGGSPIFRRRVMLALFALLGVVYGSIAGGLVLADPFLQATSLGHLSSVVTVVAAFHLSVALATPLNNACALYPQQKRLVLINALAVAGSIGCAALALNGSARTGLAVLAVISFGRTVAVGELLRTLSVLTHDAPPAPNEVVAVTAP